jgi:arylsulfatase A-like enzyme
MPIADRREFLAALASTAAAQLSRARAPKARKNVLFLAVDDLRASLGCFEDTYAITPNIDALARRGTLFRRTYCQEAVCNPSRQSLLTGCRPDTIRVWDLKTHFRNTTHGIVTLPEHFRNHGYFAQSFGKIFHGQAPMDDPPSWSVPAQFQFTPKQADYQLAKNHLHRIAGKADATEFVDASDDAYPDGEVAAGAVQALQSYAKNHTQPFFLAVGMRKPHLPFTAPLRYWKLFDNRAVPSIPRFDPPEGAPEIALHNSVELRGYLGIPQQGPLPPDLAQHLRRGYYASMAYTDAQFGRVLAALRETGLDKNTLIVLWVDHGYHLGEHGLWCKTTNYELDTHVPLIVIDPSAGHAGAVCDATVELLDIFPTVCDLCDVPAPHGLEGHSLRPWIERPSLASARPAFSQFPRPWFYKGQPDVMGYAVRTDTHRYVEWRDFRTGAVTDRELYDMRSGPIESINLAARITSKPLLDRLSRMLPAPAARGA